MSVSKKLVSIRRSTVPPPGIRPTVGGTRPVLETHIFDFEKDIYGRRITVQFIEKIREEVKFDSIDLLKSQIKKDIEEAKKILD